MNNDIFYKISLLSDEQADKIITAFSSRERCQANAQSSPAVPEKGSRIAQEPSAASEKKPARP